MLQNGTAPYFTSQIRALYRSTLVEQSFEFAQEFLEVTKGTFKATVLVETITASFQLDEIILS
jgi:malate synthase